MVDKKMCCGCSACMSICPKNCIKMCRDKEGFSYPDIDREQCIDCGLCDSVCPAQKKGEKQAGIKAYACKNKDSDIKMTSSSGGAFSVFAEYILENGGVVFGAIFDNDFKVIHSYIEDEEELYKLRGSKYVQSDMLDSYKKVKEFLDSGRKVLFSGTSCQVAGLKSYLRKDYSNLFCIDVICHGVPSPLVYEKYLKEKKGEFGQNFKSVSFRDKTEGWAEFSLKIDFDKTTYRKKVSDDKYLRGFVLNMYLRPSCYECNYKGFSSGSDISLADFWGIKKVSPEFYDENGVSMVLVNSEKGREFFASVRDKMHVKEESLEDCIKCNQAIEKPPVWNKRRSKFFKKIDTDDLEGWIEKCLKPNFINKANVRIRRILKSIK